MEELPTFVSHLECGLTGERFEADQIHGLSTAGKPLLVRYDLEALGAAVSKELAAGRIQANEGAMLFKCATGLKYPLPPAGEKIDISKPVDDLALATNRR